MRRLISTKIGILARCQVNKIDKREALLQAQYTKRFSDMEKVVNESTSSAEYVTQLVDGWNKS